MGFGRPTRYWQLDPERVPAMVGNKREVWDRAVKEASDEYKMRMVCFSFIFFFKNFRYLIKS